ncbi:hypothetical protein D9M71_80830 [compost metagenome]
MADWSELKRLAERELALREDGETYDGELDWLDAQSDLENAVLPLSETILALIAENERLRCQIAELRTVTRERDNLRAEVEILRKDKDRLDWFDRLNRSLNKHYGTSYHWKVVVNHNVNRLYLNSIRMVDMNDAEPYGLSTCREAIDAAMDNGWHGND